MHKFYHADRNASLKENQEIEIDENELSKFGAEYWPIISQRNLSIMNKSQLREFHLEEIRQQTRFSNYTSRLQSIFGANSIEDAVWFANNIKPIPENNVPIIEIYANKFWSLDMNWLDYKAPTKDKEREYYQNYWFAQISNHNPMDGERNPPRLEVLISLPAKTGRIVCYVDPQKTETPEPRQ